MLLMVVSVLINLSIAYMAIVLYRFEEKKMKKKKDEKIQ